MSKIEKKYFVRQRLDVFSFFLWAKDRKEKITSGFVAKKRQRLPRLFFSHFSPEFCAPKTGEKKNLPFPVFGAQNPKKIIGFFLHFLQKMGKVRGDWPTLSNFGQKSQKSPIKPRCFFLLLCAKDWRFFFHFGPNVSAYKINLLSLAHKILDDYKVKNPIFEKLEFFFSRKFQKMPLFSKFEKWPILCAIYWRNFYNISQGSFFYFLCAKDREKKHKKWSKIRLFPDVILCAKDRGFLKVDFFLGFVRQRPGKNLQCLAHKKNVSSLWRTK